MFKSVVSKKGTEDSFRIDSCGTGGGNANWCVHCDAALPAARQLSWDPIPKMSMATMPHAPVSCRYVEGGFSYHEGDPSDGRMRRAASQRGITITSTSRPLKPQDIHDHELLVCMVRRPHHTLWLDLCIMHAKPPRDIVSLPLISAPAYVGRREQERGAGGGEPLGPVGGSGGQGVPHDRLLHQEQGRAIRA